jgi:hypothetical protein
MFRWFEPRFLTKAAFVIVWAVGGCSSLPEFAAPRGRVVEPSSAAGGDLITYRALARSDFRASLPPPEAAAHAEKLGALTCAYIATTPGTAYEIRETKQGESRRYSVRFSSLGFVAHMDRSCSWWNQANATADLPYILQHEQIHFALAEVEARRRNREAAEVLASWREDTSSMAEAKSLVEERLRSLVDEAMEDLLDVSEEFDEDTSAKHSPERQDEWERRVEEDLAELARYRNR